MKKGKKIIVKIPKNGRPFDIGVYCLSTDSWEDFKYFLKSAKARKKAGKDRYANRYLRAALLCLFAHLEGIINQIFLEKGDKIQGSDEAKYLYDKTKVITREAKNYGSVPDLNFRLGKYLRDVIAHPGIEKHFGGQAVDEVSLFEKLTINTLCELGEKIDAWLNCVCSVFKITRFTDTKTIAGQFAQNLGNIIENKEV